MSSDRRLPSSGGESLTEQVEDTTGGMARDGTSTQSQPRRQQHQQRGGGGALGVPGRIISTLQRKFWDSNKVKIYSSSTEERAH